MYDILQCYRSGGNCVSRSVNPGSGFLDDDSVHAPMYIYNYATEWSDWVQLVVDPGHLGEHAKAITQDAVDNFYTDPTDNEDYWDTSEYKDGKHIIYTMDHGANGFDIASIGSPPRTWIVTARDVPVRLYVQKYTYSSVGKSGKKQRSRREKVYLAEYTNLLFEVAVSLDPLTVYPAQSSPAPSKHNTLSTLWGKIKAK